MHTRFASISDFIKAVEAELRYPSPIEVDYDYTVRWGADFYKLWRSEWRRERPLEASVRMMLESKARMRRKFNRNTPSPAEKHLYELFGIDWAPKRSGK